MPPWARGKDEDLGIQNYPFKAHDWSEGLLGSQEAGASLQLVLSTRTLGGWVGEFRTIAAPASQSVFTLKISIHGRMSTTEPPGGSRNQGRREQLLRVWKPASQSIVSCVQANPHFYTE